MPGPGPPKPPPPPPEGSFVPSPRAPAPGSKALPPSISTRVPDHSQSSPSPLKHLHGTVKAISAAKTIAAPVLSSQGSKEGVKIGTSQWLDPKLSRSRMARTGEPGMPPAMTSTIPPELAAMVVRQYLLPMFEGKKSLLALNKSTGTDSEAPQEDGSDEKGLASLVKHGAPQEGVYGEMKLSNQLLSSLQMLKGECTELHQRLASSEADRARLEGKLRAMHTLNENTKSDLNRVRNNEEDLRAMSEELDTECCLLERQQNQLEAELKKQQNENTNLSHRLFEEEAKVEQLSRTVAQNQNTASLSKLENDVLAEQVRDLHGAVHTLSDAKTLGDQLSFISSMHDTKQKQVLEYKEKIEIELNRVYDDRNGLLTTKKELTGANEDLEENTRHLSQDLEDAKQKSRDDLLALFEDKEGVRKERDKLEKKVKELSEDRDKLKQRLKKYRARRKMFEQDQKTCKNCSKEYAESENFNWSCRTHLSEFGGEMWWCCGKLGKDAIGCKFAKHESKDDDDDMDEQEKREKEEADKKLKNLNIRCYSCKDIGHKAKDCPRDPNPRTRYQAAKENRRIEHLANSSRKTGRVVNSNSIGEVINEKLGFDTLEGVNEEDIDPFDDVIKTCLEIVKLRKRETRAERAAKGLPPFDGDSDTSSDEDDEDDGSDESDDDEDDEDDDEEEEEEDEAPAQQGGYENLREENPPGYSSDFDSPDDGGVRRRSPKGSDKEMLLP